MIQRRADSAPSFDIQFIIGSAADLAFPFAAHMNVVQAQDILRTIPMAFLHRYFPGNRPEQFTVAARRFIPEVIGTAGSVPSGNI